MVTRENLRPGMNVRHLVSGKIGTVRADPRNAAQLMPLASFCVAVTYRKLNGRLAYPNWHVVNLEIVRSDEQG